MGTSIEVQPSSDRELVICVLINASCEKVYRAWTEPELIQQWFAPRPLTTPVVRADVQPGGSHFALMKSPDGQEYPCPGVYLEVVPGQKLVFTDAFTKAWEPSGKAFMTVTVTFEDQGGKTKYTARAMHWTKEDRDAHAQMGFVEGWTICANQLEEVASKL